jgi:hypothetical protein
MQNFLTNSILKFPTSYRFYQNTVRSKFDEYDFIKFIFRDVSKNQNIRILDLCCGDSHVLNYVKFFIADYLGIDNNPYYLNTCKKKWKNFNFLNLDVVNNQNINFFLEFKPNFIFMNGAIHHLDDNTVNKINDFIIKYFKDAYFLSIDPVVHNNNFINQLMLKLDRGNFIRNKQGFADLMRDYKCFIIDDFYKMSFQNIFHYRNLDLIKLYNNWKLAKDLV